MKHRQLIIGGLWLFSSIASLAQETSPVAGVFLTGEFNDWNPTNSLWQMQPVTNGVYRLKHFFEQGSYKFKFSVDGDWRGVNSKGALISGGEDILLAIPRHSDFVITLDLNENRWMQRVGTVDKPHAILLVRGEAEVGTPVTLDGSESVPRTGREVTTYEFGQDTNDTVRAEILAKTHEYVSDAKDATGARVKVRATLEPTARVTLPRDGTYRFWLRVSDGMTSAVATVTLKAQPSYQIVGDWTAGDPLKPATFMERAAPGVYEKLLRSEAPGEQQLILMRNHDAGDMVSHLTVSVTQTNAQFWQVRFDESDEAFTCEPVQMTEFVFHPADYVLLEDRGIEIRAVNLAGSFNNWSNVATPMTRQAGGNYTAQLKLDEGAYYYKFVVNGDIWLQDLRADGALAVDDGHEGMNSGVYVGEQGKDYGKPVTNAINLQAVRHLPDKVQYFNRASGELAQLTVRTLKDDVQRVGLHVTGAPAIPLRRAESAFGFDFWQVDVFTKAGEPLRYSVALTDGETVEQLGPFEGEGTVRFETPDWAKNVVWYQIFPERFANGTPENDPTNSLPWKWDWYQFAPKERPNESRAFSGDWYNRWFGGDFQGVIKRLPYFRELGVTALYFCPVFDAGAYHGYDTTDYRHLAQHFGFRESAASGDAAYNDPTVGRVPSHGETLDPATWQWTKSDKLFLEFIRQAHAQGLKVVVDGVFNHMGKTSFALQDVLTNGANSAYVDWFEIEDFGPPVKYKSWDGGGWMPNFRKNNKHGIASASAREYIFNITRRWMDPDGDGDPSDGVDGWRLDVAPDVPAAFWRQYRTLVKGINSNAYIVGEHWGEPVKSLQGDEWDATMNYAFVVRATRFFIDQNRKISASEFDRQLRQLLAIYPMQVNFVMQNLYDSHDTDRLVNMIINPDRNYDGDNRPQDGHRYDGSKPGADAYQVLKLMATFQMTFLGAPMIWYGDEVGMYGADDPTNRKPMLWPDLMPYNSTKDFIMPDVLNHYKRIIAIRNTYPALRTGLYRTLLTDDANDIIAFARTRRDESVAVVINNSDRSQAIELPVPFPEGSRVVDVLNASPADIVDAPLANTGFPDFAKSATVRVLRVGAAATPTYQVRDGKVQVNVDQKSAAILVKL